jgi:hypothetical protein
VEQLAAAGGAPKHGRTGPRHIHQGVLAEPCDPHFLEARAEGGGASRPAMPALATVWRGSAPWQQLPARSTAVVCGPLAPPRALKNCSSPSRPPTVACLADGSVPVTHRTMRLSVCVQFLCEAWVAGGALSPVSWRLRGGWACSRRTRRGSFGWGQGLAASSSQGAILGFESNGIGEDPVSTRTGE